VLRPLLFLIFLLPLWMPYGTAASQEFGTVTGIVFWDRNENGEHDAGELAIATQVQLRPPTDPETRHLGFDDTDEAGIYAIQSLPGQYRLGTTVPRFSGVCADTGGFSYNPFPQSRCWAARLPVTSPEFTDVFTVVAGETLTIDLPVTTRDEMVFIARAIEDTHYMTGGEIITAMVNSRPCGESAPFQTPHPDSPSGEAFVQLNVAGDAEIDGCARPGDEILFELHGRTAGQVYQYVPFTPPQLPLPRGDLHFADLYFSEDWMWVWSDDRLKDGQPYPPGTPVVARVGDVECARTTIGDIFGEHAADVPISGFGRLQIPSARIKPGCGRPIGVDIYIGGDLAIDNVPWEPALFQIGSTPPPATPTATSTATATPTNDVLPPNTGARDASRPPRGAAGLLAIGMILCAFAWIMRRRAVADC